MISHEFKTKHKLRALMIPSKNIARRIYNYFLKILLNIGALIYVVRYWLDFNIIHYYLAIRLQCCQ